MARAGPGPMEETALGALGALGALALQDLLLRPAAALAAPVVPGLPAPPAPWTCPDSASATCCRSSSGRVAPAALAVAVAGRPETPELAARPATPARTAA